MENKAHALAAGLFTLLLGAAVVVAAMWFSGETHERTRYALEAKHPVTGLNEQAIVRYRGVDIGKVTDIRFDPADSRVILIEIAIQSDILITRSTFAELRYQGVTGLSYIMLDDPGTSPYALPPAGDPQSARIPIRESVFANLAEVAQDVLGDVREAAKRLNTVLSDENQAKFTSTLANIEAATRQITVVAQAMEPAARSSDALVADARKTFQQADKLLAEISSTNRELANRLEAIDRVAASADKAGDAVASLAESVRSESLPRLNILVEDLMRTSRSLERFVTDVKDQPQSLIFGRNPARPGPGEPGFEVQGRARP